MELFYKMTTIKYCTCLILGLLIIPNRVSSGGMVRFRDGYSSADGRVEVKSGVENSEWGNICSNEFDIIDADVICRQLDYAWALYVYDVSNELGDKDVVLWEVDCRGYESNVYECNPSQTSPAGGCEDVPGVGVQCIAIDYAELDPYKKLELAGNEDDYGELEIHDNGSWKPICSYGWDIEDAVVACRQLGFISAVNYTTYTDPGSMTGIYKNFDCQNEGYLVACEHTKGECDEYVKLRCLREFEEYLPGESYNFSDYYTWPNDDPCEDIVCHNGGSCYISELFEGVCYCPPGWEGEYCGISTDGSGDESNSKSPTDFPASTDVNDNGGNNGNNANPAPTDPPAQNSSNDVIIYVAVGAGVLVLIIVVIVTIVVASTMRRQKVRKSKAKTPVEMGLKGKPVTEPKRGNNNSYQPPVALRKPVAPSSDYYLEPSPDYTARTHFDDYTALTTPASPGSELYDEIPYDSVDNGGYMDLTQPADYQPPPQLPKPR